MILFPVKQLPDNCLHTNKKQENFTTAPAESKHRLRLGNVYLSQLARKEGPNVAFLLGSLWHAYLTYVLCSCTTRSGTLNKIEKINGRRGCSIALTVY